MPDFAWVMIITLIAGVGGTGLGGLVGALFNKDSNKVVSLLLSFAGGVMLAIVCLSLIPEAIEAVEVGGIWYTIGGTAVGFAVVWILNRLIDRKTAPEIEHIDEEHPETADSPEELIHSDHYSMHASKGKNKAMVIAGLIMACAIALHNIPEGMVIGASIVSSGTIASGTGLTMAIIIGLHNIPEGMGISVPLIAGGTGKVKSVIITALCGLPTVLGAAAGFLLGTLGSVWLSLSLAFASGAMLYVVFGELLPESILIYRSKLPAIAVLAGIFVGLIVIYL